MGAFALSFPTAGFMLHLIGVRGVYVLAAAGCAVATLILIPAMLRLGEKPAALHEAPPVPGAPRLRPLALNPELRQLERVKSLPGERFGFGVPVGAFRRHRSSAGG